jgi:hypothetical protein
MEDFETISIERFESEIDSLNASIKINPKRIDYIYLTLNAKPIIDNTPQQFVFMYSTFLNFTKLNIKSPEFYIYSGLIIKIPNYTQKFLKVPFNTDKAIIQIMKTGYDPEFKIFQTYLLINDKEYRISRYYRMVIAYFK